LTEIFLISSSPSLKKDRQIQETDPVPVAVFRLRGTRRNHSRIPCNSNLSNQTF